MCFEERELKNIKFLEGTTYEDFHIDLVGEAGPYFDCLNAIRYYTERCIPYDIIIVFLDYDYENGVSTIFFE